MTITRNNDARSLKPLRLWPGVVLAITLVLARYVIPLFAADVEIFELPVAMLGIFTGMACAVAIVLWWVFFSRARWADRLVALFLIITGLVAIKFVVHPSIAGGTMGNLSYILAFPTMTLGLVAGAAAGRRLAAGHQRAAVIAGILVGFGMWTLARTEGVTGSDVTDLEWRWTPTAEERLLAEVRDEPPAVAPAVPTPAPDTTSAANATAPAPSTTAEAAKTPEKPVPTEGEAAEKAGDPTGVKTQAERLARTERVEWPGFRGRDRNSVVRGVQIDTDWSQKPPVPLWRRPIGPGWSSFAVRGDLVYTQEQRGDHEVVSAYNLKTGEPVWRHRDAVRFWESNAGAGPRGTPTVHNGRVYTMGATGILNALDADTGAAIWSRNAATDTEVTVPDWGVASSPLVVGDVVIVAVSGRLAGYDAATGKERWLGPKGGSGYSSPHLVTIDGVPQILLLRGSRTISVAPADGKLLWEHTWIPGTGIVQPALISDGEVLVVVSDAMGGLGMRRVKVARGTDGWTVEERWTSRGLKPYFSDFVIHEGHAYGFDGSIMAAIDVETGERKWKGGRYGNGQVVLLADQDVLLVISEEGELALVSATSDKFTEIARFPALDAKTWNHPVLVGDVLLVRNGEEMAAFRLPGARRLTEF
jgi:outer membrane protein assembly factor BamB